ncbi:MAG: hypothetical protein KIS90_06295, partial [Phenylobacterium sp.]|nr:hypothetical protein [Phenylobacterium sp.]
FLAVAGQHGPLALPDGDEVRARMLLKKLVRLSEDLTILRAFVRFERVRLRRVITEIECV